MRLASKRETQSRTDLTHTSRTQPAHALSQALVRYGNRVVQIDCAGTSHTVVFIEQHFRWHTANRGGDGRNCDGRQVTNSAVARENNDWPAFVRRRKMVETNVSPGYSAGHEASDSQSESSLSA